MDAVGRARFWFKASGDQYSSLQQESFMFSMMVAMVAWWSGVGSWSVVVGGGLSGRSGVFFLDLNSMIFVKQLVAERRMGLNIVVFSMGLQGINGSG